MNRWHWMSLVILTIGVLVFAMAASRWGSSAERAVAVGVTATPWAYIDKVNNGLGWCDPAHIDDETTEYVGDNHQLAICIGNLPEAVHEFILYLSYDIDLDQCIEESCTDDFCLDDNPDANAGTTKWGDSLGEGWDCSGSAQRGPDPECTYYTSGPPELPYIWCEGGESATYTLGDDETWGVLAVVDFDVIDVGTDNVTIESLVVGGEEGAIGGCQTAQVEPVRTQGAAPIPCATATDHKEIPPTSTPHKRKPTATPTATEVPTATAVPTHAPPPPPAATPYGGVGPAVQPPATGTGGGGSSWTLATWLLVGVGGAATVLGALRLRASGR